MITISIDLSRPGKQSGVLELPHSVNGSSYGRVFLPIVSVKNGNGPTILIMAGNHGDEYVGQITALKIARRLQAKDVEGQVIILTAANYPAALAGTRTSPLDQGNLNRSFPGDPAGSPTEKIANFIETELLKRADYAIDLHGGDTSTAFSLATIVVGGRETPGFEERMMLAEAIGLPDTIIYRLGRDVTHLGSGATGAAIRQKTPLVATEIGFGGTTTPQDLRRCEVGVMGALKTLGVVGGSAPSRKEVQRVLVSDQSDDFVYAMNAGIFEPNAQLGDWVEASQLAGWIHDRDNPTADPTECIFNASGFVINLRLTSRVLRGDLLYRLAHEDSDPFAI